MGKQNKKSSTSFLVQGSILAIASSAVLSV